MAGGEVTSVLGVGRGVAVGVDAGVGEGVALGWWMLDGVGVGIGLLDGSGFGVTSAADLRLTYPTAGPLLNREIAIGEAIGKKGNDNGVLSFDPEFADPT